MANPLSTLGSTAGEYATQYGWLIVPLHGVQDGTCSCHRGSDCPSPGKHPREGTWQASADVATIHRWWAQWPHANIGVQTGPESRIAVLDVDVYKGGDTDLARLEATYGPLPPTPLVLTGGGGLHYYFRIETDIPSFKPAAAIDFQAGHGKHLVVAPPSRHRSGREYAWEVQAEIADMPLAPLPSWLAELAETHRHTMDRQAPLPSVLPEVRVEDLQCSKRLRWLIREGVDPDNSRLYSSRSEALFAVIIALEKRHDDATIAAILLNPDYAISEKILEQSRPRVWLAAELSRARVKGQTPIESPRGITPREKPLMAQAGAQQDKSEEDWQHGLLLTTGKHPVPKTCLGNMGLFLAHDPLFTAEDWWYDTFLDRAMCGKAPVDDVKKDYVLAGLHQRRMAVANRHMVSDAIGAHCRIQRRDSLQTWLSALVWDQMPRLDDWLFRCGNAPLAPVNVWIGRIILLQMVARAVEPGGIIRYTAIFKGPQNTGKTEAVLALGTPWSGIFDMSLDTKDAQLALRGLWVAELGELDTVYRSRYSRLKSFLTQRKDHLVKKYDNDPTDYLRRTVFVGTTNDEEFLPKGDDNQRFLPVETPEWNLGLLAEWRDQLFAEAFVFLQQHPADWWHNDPGMHTALQRTRLESQHSSALEGPLESWIHFKAGETFRMDEVLSEALHIDPLHWTPAKEMEIGAILRKFGWRSVPRYDSETKLVRRRWEKSLTPAI